MMRFRSFVREIREMAEVNVSDLDAEFLKRAQKVTSFNLTSKDFTSLKHKKEIQHLFRTHFFPKFNLDKTISGKPTKIELNNLIRSLFTLLNLEIELDLVTIETPIFPSLKKG